MRRNVRDSLPALPGHTHQMRHRRRGTKRPVYNRLPAVLEHVPRYTINGPARLAADAAVSQAAVSRLINGHSSPSYRLVCALTAAVERHLGRRIDPRELVSPDGEYETSSACKLSGCRGCLPRHFYNDDDEIKPEYRGIKPGEWSITQPAANLDAGEEAEQGAA